MRNDYGRASVLVRAAACALLTLGIASPAVAQFGGLKKKLKAAAGAASAADGQQAAGTGSAPAAAGATGRGGSVVLTPEVVDQLVKGLRAAAEYRESARKADSPNNRYLQAKAAYEAAQVKCSNSRQAFINRMANDEKLAKQYTDLMDKMAAAQGKADYKQSEALQYQLLAMQDPSCAVKEPTRPDDYNDAERDIGAKAEQAGIQSSGLTAAEFAMGLERGEGILLNNPPPDASASEKSAVNAKAAELKSLLGIQDESAGRAKKFAPEPAAPAPAPQATDTAVPSSGNAMSDCMMKNVKKHEAQIQALGERAKAAQEAGDMPLTLAIADTLRQLQMAGCNAGQ